MMFSKTEEIDIKSKRVNNPGAGNCAFYAFAIGLIDIIQEENIYDNKAMFDHWVELDNSISESYKEICNFNMLKPHSHDSLLDMLQSSLRKILYSIHEKALQEVSFDPSKLLTNKTFCDFSELYYSEYNELRIDSNYNVFAKCKSIQDEIDKIKKDNKQATEDMLQAKLLNDKQLLLKKENEFILLEREQLIKAFLRLYYGTDQDIVKETPFLKSSEIIKAMKRKLQNYFWGTFEDLNDLAPVFNVNLHCLQNGRKSFEFQDLPDLHTITLNNEGNSHWTTEVKMAQIKSLQNDKESISKNERYKESKKIFQSDSEQLEQLKQQVEFATNAYNDHSSSIRFCLFHWHGSTGRKRASAFAERFKNIKTLDKAKESLIDYLSNDAHGNTNPHSYRTMLLAEVLVPRVTYHAASEAYNRKVYQLKQNLGIESLLPKMHLKRLVSHYVSSGKMEKANKIMDENPDFKIDVLLGYIVSGNQDEAQKMLKKEPGLLLKRGSVIDPSDRHFKDISAFKLVLWLMDVRYMANMMLDCIPETKEGDIIREQLILQYDTLEEDGLKYKLNDLNYRSNRFNFTPLIKALKTYAEDCDSVSLEDNMSNWRDIGKEQCELPIHVRSHYCEPRESFELTPTFDKKEFKRELDFYNFTEYRDELWDSKITNLGVDSAIYRGGAMGAYLHTEPSASAKITLDLGAMQCLEKVRTQDRMILKERLVNTIKNEKQSTGSTCVIL